MAQMPQWYKDYLEDIRRLVGWMDRLRFKQVLHNAVPALLQNQKATLITLLAADVYGIPFCSRMDENNVVVREAAEFGSSKNSIGRSIVVLTSQGLHVFPEQSPRSTTFVGDQLLALWRINNRLLSIEIPYVPHNTMKILQTTDYKSFDPDAHVHSLVLRVKSGDWAVANMFWAVGNAVGAGNLWGDPDAITRHIQNM